MNEEILKSYSTILEIVDKTAIFGALSEAEIREVLSYMSLKKYKKGEIIFEQDSSPNQLYIIENGIIKLYHKNKGNEYKLKVYTTGECFGEIAMLGIMPYIGNSIAMSDVSLLQLSKSAFHQLSKANLPLFTKFLLNITREICRHNYYLDKYLIDTLEENNLLNNLKK